MLNFLFAALLYRIQMHTQNVLLVSRKNLMNKYFPIRIKTITQRRMHSPWITTGIVKCIRKRHRCFRLLRNCLLSYNMYKLYVGKLRLLLRTAGEQYFVRTLISRYTDMKRNWKILNRQMGKNKKWLKKEFIVDGVSTTDTTKNLYLFL